VSNPSPHQTHTVCIPAAGGRDSLTSSGGDGREAALVSGGYGLASMERGVLYGRQREAGLSEDGLIVRLRVPIDLGPRTERS